MRKVIVQLMHSVDNLKIANAEMIVAQNWDMGMLPGQPISKRVVPPKMDQMLADPAFNTPAPVKILLGAGVVAKISQWGKTIRNRGFTFQPTSLGVLVFGGNVYENAATAGALVEKEDDIKLTQLVERFWQLDDIPLKRMRTIEQEECEDMFIKTYQRTAVGQYVVNIPMRRTSGTFGSSETTALRRFLALERRFEKDETLRLAYIQGMREMISAGHLKEVSRLASGWCYYVPHHAVTTKFRIVFDGSCKTDQGISINDIQLVGEKLQEDLFGLILRFRMHRIGITADIKKMYLQVHVSENQWDLQRVFWREDCSTDIKSYWLTRITFGMASAPHSAVRAMIQCAKDEGWRDPEAAKKIQGDFYMDDCLTGADNEANAQALCVGMSSILEAGGFPLRKWQSNVPHVLPSEPEVSHGDVSLGHDAESTVLGLRWAHDHDELKYKFRPRSREEQRLTKRDILRQTAEVFDPCGFVGPVMIVSKTILQDLHKEKVGWDDKVPEHMEKRWLEWQTKLVTLTHLRIPRWYGTSPSVTYSLHGFADASTVAYGAVVYIRLEEPGRTSCKLMASKSRVAPIKTMTIPRLELCSAVLAVKLMEVVKESCRLPGCKTTFWSDSAIVLYWMRKDSDSLKPFVNNRIQTITRKSEGCEWRHIAGSENPADCVSRGISPEALQKHNLWWHGPPWLQEDCQKWPRGLPELTKHIQEGLNVEIKSNWMDSTINHGYRERLKGFVGATTLKMSSADGEREALSSTSTLRRAVRRTAWLWRFINNCRSTNKNMGELTAAEEEQALITLIKEEQGVYYQVELKVLQESGQIPKTSQILKLNPILIAGIVRVGGRLENSLCSEDQKHPIILPDVSHLAKLLIGDAHQLTFHGGYQVMAATLRQRFWIVNLRRAIKTSLSRCIPCIRQRQKVGEQIMGSLPADRVRPNAAFQTSGVDYAGPFEVKARSGKCKIMEKKYVAVFVCMVTKAVHLELVENLSTAAFIAAFHRFTSLRGSCTQLWSDNGTGFVGAAKQLGKMVSSWAETDSESFKELCELRVKWNFITPSAPHQGGLWEAAVRSMKYHLRRVVGKQTLDGDHFRTLLAQISAILNSRPLSALSTDSEDLDFLTPGHFIIGRSMKQMFGPRLDESPRNALKRYEMTQHMSQCFWKHWRASYLNDLQQRTKWITPQRNAEVGDLVLIKEDNLPPTLWKTARIIKTTPGADGLVRNVELRVPEKKQTLCRAIQKLVFLPFDKVEEMDSALGEQARRTTSPIESDGGGLNTHC